MVYKELGNRKLKVDVFQPKAGKIKSGRPVIAFFHGGGWVFGDRSEFHGACARFAEKGFVTCSFEYRVSMREDGTYPHPDITPVESAMDGRSAVRWLRLRADDLGIDPDRVVTCGQSAGGHLAWATALLDGIDEKSDDMKVSPQPNALVLFSGCYNTVEAWCDWVLGDNRKQLWDISPHHRLRAELPPALGFHSKSDSTVKHYIVRLFAERTRELGNSFELVTFEDRPHRLAPGVKEYDEMFDEEMLVIVDRFLKANELWPASD